jgi:hypothetical protein
MRFKVETAWHKIFGSGGVGRVKSSPDEDNKNCLKTLRWYWYENNGQQRRKMGTSGREEMCPEPRQPRFAGSHHSGNTGATTVAIQEPTQEASGSKKTSNMRTIKRRRQKKHKIFFGMTLNSGVTMVK